MLTSVIARKEAHSQVYTVKWARIKYALFSSDFFA
jgi:hypothetical protein